MSAADPLRLRFEAVARSRPWSLLAPFAAHDLAAPPSPPDGDLAELDPGPVAPFCAVVGDVGEAGPDTLLRLGLAGEGVRVLAVWDGGAVSLEVLGPRSAFSVSAPEPVTARAGLALAVSGDRVVVLVRADGGQWRPVLAEDTRVRECVDLRDPAVLRGLRYVHGGRGVRLDRLRAGCSGPVGVRDPQLVRTTRGEPVVRDGRAFLTMTSAGFGFFPTASWGVWAIDLADPTRVEQVGAVFSARDGLVLGDHAGQLVVDERTGTTSVLVSSWGDFSPETGVHVRHATTGEDLLAGVHVLPTERLRLPSAHSTWDPSLARIGGRWHVAFVECPSFGPPRFVFRPALARTDSRDHVTGLVRVGADDGREQTEGTLLQRVGRRWYLMASDGDAREHPVYEPGGMSRLGTLRAPYGTNIPHPALVPAAPGAPAAQWLVTFDGTPWHDDVLGYGTHGDLLVLAGRVDDGGSGVRRAVRAVRRRADLLGRG